MGNLFVDEPCLVSFFIGELGWFLQRYQGYLRYIKNEKYPDHKCLLMTNMQFHPIVNDFVNYTLDLPKEFRDLKLETDGYEAPLATTEGGGLTPPNVWSGLIQYFRQHYNVEKAVELWTPRGCNTFIDSCPQTFVKYETDEIEDSKPIITVFPRHRKRGAQRNVPIFVWRELVDILSSSNKFRVVLAGTPNGSALADYEGKNVINMIPYNKDDKLEIIIKYIVNSELTVGSQSGLTHLSLLCDRPTYTIGHEKQRHTVYENRYNTPTSFRYVTDYRAIDAETIVDDIEQFISVLIQNNVVNVNKFTLDYSETTKNDSEILSEIINMRLQEAEDE